MAAIQFNTRIDFFFFKFDGRSVRKFKPDAVESSIGVSRLEFIPVILGRAFTVFRHLPCGENHLGRPAVIAKGFHHRVFLDAQRALRTCRNAITSFFLAYRAKTEMTFRLGKIFIPGTFYMHALGTHFNALAAFDTSFFVSQNNIFGDLIPVSGWSRPYRTRLFELRRTGLQRFFRDDIFKLAIYFQKVCQKLPPRVAQKTSPVLRLL